MTKSRTISTLQILCEENPHVPVGIKWASINASVSMAIRHNSISKQFPVESFIQQVNPQIKVVLAIV